MGSSDAPDDMDANIVLALKKKGTDLFKEGKLAEAREAYSSAIDLDPDLKHPEAHIILANRALMALKLSQPKDCEKSNGDGRYTGAVAEAAAASARRSQRGQPGCGGGAHGAHAPLQSLEH